MREAYRPRWIRQAPRQRNRAKKISEIMIWV